MAWLNGTFLDDDHLTISAKDAGFLHASGVFTTMRADGGRVAWLEKHLMRLRESCEALFVPLKYSDLELQDAVLHMLHRENLTDARLRLTVTRGQISTDPLHGTVITPTCLITAVPLAPPPPETYQSGMAVFVNDEQKLNPYDMQAGHKTLDYFSRFAALTEATRRKVGEALWFNVHNFLQSASTANVLLIEDGALVTPPTQTELRKPELAEATPYKRSNVLPGITRAAVLELAREAGLAVKTEAVDINRLLAADELMITNSIIRIVPVTRIERMLVGRREGPGPITQDLMQRMDAML